MTQDAFNMIAWRDFLLWAWSDPEIRAQFTMASGLAIQAARLPIHEAIDAATGAREDLVSKFVEWATREHWGLEHAPAAYQKAIAAKIDPSRVPSGRQNTQ